MNIQATFSIILLLILLKIFLFEIPPFNFAIPKLSFHLTLTFEHKNSTFHPNLPFSFSLAPILTYFSSNFLSPITSLNNFSTNSHFPPINPTQCAFPSPYTLYLIYLSICLILESSLTLGLKTRFFYSLKSKNSYLNLHSSLSNLNSNSPENGYLKNLTPAISMLLLDAKLPNLN